MSNDYKARYKATLASLQRLVGYPIEAPDASTASYVASGELMEYVKSVGLKTGVSIGGKDMKRIGRLLVADDAYDFSTPSPARLEAKQRQLVDSYFLIRAILQKDAPSTRRLIESGADVDARCWLDEDHSYFPLIQAAIVGSPEIVRLLVESGADINQQQMNGESALANAANIASREHLQIAQYLLAHGANPNTIAHGKLTPLAVADNSAMVRLLLDHGADPNIPDIDGNLPIRARIDNGDWESVSMLVAAGTNLDHRNKNGVSPRDRAKKLGVEL